MWHLLLAFFMIAQTQVVDDPFEQSIIYITPLDSESSQPQVIYADEKNCSFMQVGGRTFVSQRKRGARDASSFLEFTLTALYKETCGDPVRLVDITQARYLGGMEADVSVQRVSANCAITTCKDEYNVSVRLTAGMSSRNEDVALKFGAPHSGSFIVRFPMKSYMNHRREVVG